MEKKKKSIILLGAAGAVLVLIVFLAYPVIKLEVISRYYQWYGSYVILPDAAVRMDEKPAVAKTRHAAYDRKGIKLTNMLYYRELRQLAFGFIYGDDPPESYQVLLLDADGRQVPGKLNVSGADRFYSRRLQKLNFQLEEPLRPQAPYTIRIADEKGERIGDLTFAYE